jgi:hypothetical protein
LGIFNIQTTVSTSNTDFRIVIKSPSPVQTNIQDIEYLYNIIFTNQKNSKDYYKFDINLSNEITISDVYSFYRKNLGNNIHPQTPINRYFKQSEWNIISSSTENLLQTYQGEQNLTISNLITGGNDNFYLIRLGKKD